MTYSTQNATPYQTSVTNFTFFIFSTFLTSTFVVVASFRHTPCKFHAFNYRLLAKPILKFIATVLIPVNWQCLLNLTRWPSNYIVPPTNCALWYNSLYISSGYRQQFLYSPAVLLPTFSYSNYNPPQAQRLVVHCDCPIWLLVLQVLKLDLPNVLSFLQVIARISFHFTFFWTVSLFVICISIFVRKPTTTTHFGAHSNCQRHSEFLFVLFHCFVLIA